MTNNYSSTLDADALFVIGYGNELRGDDGVGPRVADAMATMNLPGVRTMACTLLTPELADAISHARIVVFVDACVDAPNGVQLRHIEPNESSQIMAHAADPRTLLALSRDIFGRVPQSWWLAVPAFILNFNQHFSPGTRSGLAEAVKKLLILCRSLQMS